MQPKFIYFDLGKVLVDFSVERMCRQIGNAAGVDAARVEEAVFARGRQLEYESGQLSSGEFHDLSACGPAAGPIPTRTGGPPPISSRSI